MHFKGIWFASHKNVNIKRDLYVEDNFLHTAWMSQKQQQSPVSLLAKDLCQTQIGVTSTIYMPSFACVQSWSFKHGDGREESFQIVPAAKILGGRSFSNKSSLATTFPVNCRVSEFVYLLFQINR